MIYSKKHFCIISEIVDDSAFIVPRNNDFLLLFAYKHSNDYKYNLSLFTQVLYRMISFGTPFSWKLKKILMFSECIMKILKHCPGFRMLRFAEVQARMLKKLNNPDVQLFLRDHLHMMPYRYFNDEIIKIVLRYWPQKIKFVPEDMITMQIMQFMMFRRPSAIGHIPKHLITHELIDYALSLDTFAIKHIPRCLITEEMLINVVSRDHCAIGCVPDRLKTPKVITAAILHDKRAIQHIPRRLLTNDIMKMVECSRKESKLAWERSKCVLE